MIPKAKIHPAKVIEFHASLTGQVDKNNGIVRGVSLITGGIQARGHDLEVDDTTLKQVHDLATAMVKVPVKWNHKTGADAVNGYVTEFRIEGNKVKGDWHLLTTHAQYEQALELAERMPGNIGLSAAFLGKEEVVGGKKKARCEELISVDLVAQPAANPDGLFEARVDTRAGAKLMDTPTPAGTPDNEPSLREVMDLLQAQSEAINQLTERVESYETAGGGDEELTQEDLETIANLGDDQLEALGISPEQRDELAAHLAGAGGDDGQGAGGQDEGPFAARGDFAHNNAPSPAAVAAELSDLRKRVVRFERKESAELQAAETEAVEQAFSVIEEKVTMLAAENDALRHAFATGSAEAVTPGGEIIHFERGPSGAPRRQNQTEFEARVEALKGEGKKPTEAILLAQKEDPARYQTHLEAKGVKMIHT